ncbi:MAG: hypothetical protein AB7J13_09040 [Pyrinomonadaceae bacterium]
MKRHIGAVSAIGLLITIGLACGGGSFTTANISDLKFGLNNTAEPSSTTFKTGEDIYALASVSNVPKGKYKLTWRITYEDVKGKAPGQEIGTNTREFEGSSRLWQTFSSPLPGEYKVEATLARESGEEVDKKSGTVTITE